jgi:hypothetical protein
MSFDKHSYQFFSFYFFYNLFKHFELKKKSIKNFNTYAPTQSNDTDKLEFFFIIDILTKYYCKLMTIRVWHIIEYRLKEFRYLNFGDQVCIILALLLMIT